MVDSVYQCVVQICEDRFGVGHDALHESTVAGRRAKQPLRAGAGIGELSDAGKSERGQGAVLLTEVQLPV